MGRNRKKGSNRINLQQFIRFDPFFQSIEERYANHDAYVGEVEEAAKRLVEKRLLLEDDVELYVELARQRDIGVEPRFRWRHTYAQLDARTRFTYRCPRASTAWLFRRIRCSWVTSWFELHDKSIVVSQPTS